MLYSGARVGHEKLSICYVAAMSNEHDLHKTSNFKING